MKKFVFVFVLAFSVCATVNAQITVTAAEAKNYVNQIVSVCDRIADAKFLDNTTTKPTLLNIGGTYPNNLFTIVINFESRSNFSFKPEDYYVNKRVCVTGKVAVFKGKPQIVVLSPAEIIIDESATSPVETTVPKVTASAIIDMPKTNSEPVTNLKPADTKATDTKTANTPATKKTETSAPKVSQTDMPANAYPIKLTNDVNLRKNPSNTAEVVELIKKGSTVWVLSSANGWSAVQYKPAEGQVETVLKGYIKNSVLQ